MAFDKLVDSAKLEMEMTATAVAIRNKTGLTDTIPWEDNTGFANAVAAITVGGGSSEDVRYVTFFNEDGTIEYGKKAVATGDDCADPIARGVFNTPTKESTAQYNYTFGGWATTPGGGIDANALKAVTEDRTVYANFISALRYYTITFYDSDGTTMKEQTLAYGTMPSYDPFKEGYDFKGWNPELTAVTGNANYTAVWEESLSFAAASWETIAARSADGTASQLWKVGDKKKIPYSGGELSLVIAGFKHDDLADGTGKAGISIVFDSLPSSTYYWDSATTGRTYVSNTYLQNNLNNILGRFPAELKAVIKPVTKQACDTSSSGTGTTTIDQSLWMLSIDEMGVAIGNNEAVLGKKYDYFKAVSSTSKIQNGVCTNQTTNYWTRSTYRPGQLQIYNVRTTGVTSKTSGSSITGSGSQYQYRLGFCV